MAEVKKPILLDDSFNTESAKHLELKNALLKQTTIIAESQASISKLLEQKDSIKRPQYENGVFTNSSIQSWLFSNNDGKLYGVDQTLDAVQTCTKVLANAGIANPVPSTLAQVGSDPYYGIGPFRYERVNAVANDDGTYSITGMESFGHFTTDKDVFILTPIRYVSHGMTSDGKYRIVVSDEPNVGLHPEPRAYKQDGDLQPFMLRAAYAAALVDDAPVSRPGLAPWTRSCSWNTMKSKAQARGKMYSALTAADLDYIYDMFLLKYANKSSQTVFAGCTSYNYSYKPKYNSVLSEDGTYVSISDDAGNTWKNEKNIMIALTSTQAANLIVGSYVSLGSVYGTDRATATTYDICSMVKILNIDTTSATNLDTVLVTLDIGFTGFTAGANIITTDGGVITEPWHTGACDGIIFDGSPTNPLSGKEPFVFQGIELGLGFYEWVGDLIEKADGSTVKLHLYEDVAGTAEPKAIYEYPASTEGWRYPFAMTKKSDIYTPQKFGASTTTGVGDGTYMQPKAGTHGFRAFGNLGVGASAGLRCANLYDGLGWTWWYNGSRVSVNGRNEVSLETIE